MKHLCLALIFVERWQNVARVRRRFSEDLIVRLISSRLANLLPLVSTRQLIPAVSLSLVLILARVSILSRLG